AAHREALAIRKPLAAEFPAWPEFRQDLARSHSGLGLVFLMSGQSKDAESAFLDALALYRPLAASFPTRADVRHGLAYTLFNLSLVCNTRRDFQAAKAYLEEAGPHHQGALKANSRDPFYRRTYRTYLFALAKVNVRLKDGHAAVRAAEALRDLGWDPPADAYDAACALGRCIPVVPKDKMEMDAEREKAV